jgi:hypothetical protein
MIEVNHEGCWVWAGSRDRDGYGRARMDGNTWQAHRAAYVLYVGPIAPGAVNRHTCRNRACANSWHLEATTCFQNTMRGISPPACNARKARCQHGHVFEEANTDRYRRRRSCRACNAAAARRYKAKMENALKALDHQLSLQWGAP